MRVLPVISALVITLSACGAAEKAPSEMAPTASAIALATPTPMPEPTPSFLSPVPDTPGPTAAPTLAPTPTSSPGPTLVTGWPTVSRLGVTMTGRYTDTQPAWESWPAPGPEVTLVVVLAGLTPGESVSLAGTAAYDFGLLGCGVEPTPCSPGSDPADSNVGLCRPKFGQAAKGTARTTVEATAEADGTAVAALRFVMSQAQRACPAGPSLPWYVQSGEWKLRVTDKAHGLRLVGPPVGFGP